MEQMIIFISNANIITGLISIIFSIYVYMNPTYSKLSVLIFMEFVAFITALFVTICYLSIGEWQGAFWIITALLWLYHMRNDTIRRIEFEEIEEEW